jgi:hypothetical protein
MPPISAQSVSEVTLRIDRHKSNGSLILHSDFKPKALVIQGSYSSITGYT